MSQNVLVFPCGSEIGLEIHRSIKDSIHFNLIGASSVDDHGSYVYENYIANVPSVDDPSFIDEINKLISAHDIDFIFPAHDSVVLKLAQAKAQGALSCNVITSPVETCEIARSKLATYRALEGIIPVPRIYERSMIAEDMLPLFLKPDVGQGSRGTYKAAALEEIDFYSKQDPSLLLLEYLPGKEFTIDCFNNIEGKLIFCEGRERMRVSNGISVQSQIVENDQFRIIAEKIAEKIAFTGVWFFQLKEARDGTLTLLEIAPRVAGTMGLIRGLGVNLPLLSLFQAIGVKVSVIKNEYDLVIDRALENCYKHNISYKHAYIDFDDLIVIRDQVNLAAIAFIYQCLNKGVKLHLLTKHKLDIANSLKKYHLEGLFDEVVVIPEDYNKDEYIKETDAIFIDDSFAERKRVHEAKGIPTFDSHMLESLMD